MDASNNLIVKQAAAAISNGGVIAYPTSSIWGLGCSLCQKASLQKLCKIKQRPKQKGLIIIAGDWEQLAGYFPNLTAEQINRIITPSQHPCTWLVEDSDNKVPDLVKGDNTKVAIRLDHHSFVKQLCVILQQPITSTSANPAGKNPATSANEVKNYFADGVDYVVGGEWQDNDGVSGKPSNIRDLNSGEYIRGFA